MLRLRDDLHWCDCEGRAVFLDTREDRYFCLPRAANDAFLRLGEDAAQADHQRLQPLLERGLLIAADAEFALQPPAGIDGPSRDWLEDSSCPARPLALFRAIAAELSAAIQLRTGSLHQVLARSRSLRPAAGAAGSDVIRSVDAIAAAEALASYVLRAHDRCLVRALATHSLCKRAGARTRLIFGVAAQPFSAHCWVQLGSAVIVGSYEQARLYTPILVVE